MFLQPPRIGSGIPRPSASRRVCLKQPGAGTPSPVRHHAHAAQRSPAADSYTFTDRATACRSSCAPPPAAPALAPPPVAPAFTSPPRDADASSSASSANNGGGSSVTCLTAASFQAFVDECGGSGKLMVVDWYTPMCGPCKLMAPVLEDLARQFPGIAFAKFDCHADEAQQAFAGQVRVKALPTFHMYQAIPAGAPSSSPSGAPPCGTLLLLAEVTGGREKELRRAVAAHRQVQTTKLAHGVGEGASGAGAAAAAAVAVAAAAAVASRAVSSSSVAAAAWRRPQQQAPRRLAANR
ncbi:hypothetical protein FOA52_007152 [Chlamydomonas sp. UWO 241]|nr:hypothetical protein FOA52_007152 [Chlamydomonas sp. UWO 241]